MTTTTLGRIRRLHNYLAVFFAPAILFFAFTGGLQTLDLHEAHGDQPAPPRWIAAIASLHKHQVIARPRHRPAGDDHAAQAGRVGKDRPVAGKLQDDHDDHGGLGPLKLFVLLLSVALFATTALGLIIAIISHTSRGLSLILAVLGIVVPLALVLA